MTRELKSLYLLIIIKKKLSNYILKMFNRYLLTLLNQKDEYTILKREVSQTPLEKSINAIIEKVKQDIDKITKLNQFDYIY